MKTSAIYSFLVAVLIVGNAHAQLIKSINFDTYTSSTNNDLVNNFIGGYTFIQQQTGGITGGAIPINAASETQPATYNKSIKISAAKTTASICFKYSNAAFQDNSLEAASLTFLSDPILKIMISATGQGLSTGNNYSGSSIYINSGGKLADGHWYQLKGELEFGTSSSSLNVSAWLYDLGTSGTASPALVLSLLNKVYTNEFAANNNMVNLQFFGYNRGGGVMLDNFNINSQTVGVDDPQFASSFIISTINNNKGFYVSNSLNSTVSYELLGSNGAIISKGLIQKSVVIPTSFLATGTYFLRIYNQENSITRKIVNY